MTPTDEAEYLIDIFGETLAINAAMEKKRVDHKQHADYWWEVIQEIKKITQQK